MNSFGSSMPMQYNKDQTLIPSGIMQNPTNLMLQPNNNINMQSISNMLASNMNNLPMVPFVGQFFERLEAVQNNFMMKYDMKVQKEICQIQVKYLNFIYNFFYFCITNSIGFG